MPNTPSEDLLGKYLAGDCSDAEKHVVEAWYEALADPHRLARRAIPTTAQEEKILQRIKQKIADQKGNSFRINPASIDPWYCARSWCAVTC